MANFDDMKLAVESLTGGKNTVLLDDAGLPSVVVAFPKHTNKELFGGSDQTHSGHIVNGVEKSVMYVDKFQDIVYGGRGYSLPMRDPATYVNFDQAVQYARAKGKGWGLIPFALWAEIALFCRANGTMPHGNNNYGSDASYPLEKGVGTYYDSSAKKERRTATGSGPETWNHDGTGAGIADLNGNIWEWNAGLRLVDGEIQIIPYCNSMLQEVSLGSASTSWKAIASDGSLVDPGTSGTLKYSNSANQLATTVTPTDSGRWESFSAMTLASGLTAPEIAKELILYPAEAGGDYGGDYYGWNTSGERVALCGGFWGHGGGAGVFPVDLGHPRSDSNDYLGFRSAFCEL
jgi:hypothetical protein